MSLVIVQPHSTGVVEPLEEGTINFSKLTELTTLIDLWEDSELGDFSVSYENGIQD